MGATAFKKENEARGLVFPSCAARLKTARPSRMPGTWLVAVTGRGARATAAYSFQFSDGQITYGVSFHRRIGRRHMHRVAHRVHHFPSLLSQFPDSSTKSNGSLRLMPTSLWTNGRARRRAGCLRWIGIAGARSTFACPRTTAADAVQLIGCQTTHSRGRHVVDAHSVNDLSHHVKPCRSMCRIQLRTPIMCSGSAVPIHDLETKSFRLRKRCAHLSRPPQRVGMRCKPAIVRSDLLRPSAFVVWRR
jgi:hypothetical protein